MGIYGWGLIDSGISHLRVTANWLYRSKLFAHDGTGYDSTWTKIEGEAGQLAAARNWLAQNPGGTVCFTVAILPGYQATPASGLSLSGGAAGNYNAHFATLANNLVTYQLANNIIIRLGHEFTGNWYPWKVQSNADAVNYRNYWIQIVNTMRAIAPNLKFEWCGANNSYLNGYTLADAYPGNAYVDYIGVDVYDECYYQNTYPYGSPLSDLQRQQNAWAYQSGAAYNGFEAWKNFAISQGKPFTIPEWGLNDKVDGGVQRGGLDNPYFIQKMYEFIHEPANQVYYHCYYDIQAPDGLHQLTQLPNGSATGFPNAAKLFQKLFGIKPLPQNADIGSVGLSGSGDVTTFSGAGLGFVAGATSDSFNFSSKSYTGNCELTLRIASMTPGAATQTGIMLRQSTAPDAAYAALFVSNGQYVFNARSSAGSAAATMGTIGTASTPVWLKLARNGNVVTGYKSLDGFNWTFVGTRTVSMTGAVYLGVAVSSGSVASLNTSEIDRMNDRDIQTNDTASVNSAIIVDNAAASGVTLTGAWTASTFTAGYYGSNYIHDGATGKGSKSVQFAPALATAGDYDVYIRWPAKYQWSGSTPVTVNSASGATSLTVNQEEASGKWLHIGCYPFLAGSTGTVTIANTGTPTTTYVVADAVMFVPRPGGPAVPSLAKIINNSASKSLRPYEAGTADNVNIVLFSYNNTWTTEQWQMNDLGNGYYNIVNGYTGKALRPLNAATTTGANIVQYTTDSTWQSEQWELIPAGAGSFGIRNRYSSLALRPQGGGTTDNVPIVQEAYDGASLSMTWQVAAP